MNRARHTATDTARQNLAMLVQSLVNETSMQPSISIDGRHFSVRRSLDRRMLADGIIAMEEAPTTFAPVQSLLDPNGAPVPFHTLAHRFQDGKTPLGEADMLALKFMATLVHNGLATLRDPVADYQAPLHPDVRQAIETKAGVVKGGLAIRGTPALHALIGSQRNQQLAPTA